jgi:hypothetical protein
MRAGVWAQMKLPDVLITELPDLKGVIESCLESVKTIKIESINDWIDLDNLVDELSYQISKRIMGI